MFDKIIYVKNSEIHTANVIEEKARIIVCDDGMKFYKTSRTAMQQGDVNNLGVSFVVYSDKVYNKMVADKEAKDNINRIDNRVKREIVNVSEFLMVKVENVSVHVNGRNHLVVSLNITNTYQEFTLNLNCYSDFDITPSGLRRWIVSNITDNLDIE